MFGWLHRKRWTWVEMKAESLTHNRLEVVSSLTLEFNSVPDRGLLALFLSEVPISFFPSPLVSVVVAFRTPRCADPELTPYGCLLCLFRRESVAAIG